MANQTYQPVLVTGINSDDDCEIVRAHARALEFFEQGLVSELSAVGHNFVQSFCVFPSGSGNERDGQLAHRAAVNEYCKWLSGTNLDFVAVSWDESADPVITHAHGDMDCSGKSFQL